MIRRRLAVRLARLAPLAAIIAVAPLPGCGEEISVETPETDRPVIRYETRGRVVEMPEAGNPRSEFLVQHEPIPAFKANYNETQPSGMNSMIMPFPLAPDVSLEDIAEGDAIAIEFTVDYDEQTGAVSQWRAISIEKLPGDIELTFGRVEPEAGSDQDDGGV